MRILCYFDKYFSDIDVSGDGDGMDDPPSRLDLGTKSSPPNKGSSSASRSSFPWVYAIAGVAGVLIITAIALIAPRSRRRKVEKTVPQEEQADHEMVYSGETLKV